MTNEEYMSSISKELKIGEIKSNPDGSKYVPIGIIQNKLDELFNGEWNFVLERETFGKHEITASGKLSYVHPVTRALISRSGTAAIAYRKEMRLDYPALEARVILNAAKKIGTYFGRDLNREMEDAPLEVIQIEKTKEIDDELVEFTKKLDLIESYEEAHEMLQSSTFKYNQFLATKISLKPFLKQLNGKQ